MRSHSGLLSGTIAQPNSIPLRGMPLFAPQAQEPGRHQIVLDGPSDPLPASISTKPVMLVQMRLWPLVRKELALHWRVYQEGFAFALGRKIPLHETALYELAHRWTRRRRG